VGWAAILLLRATDWSYRDQVTVLDTPNVVSREGHERLGLARSGDELDLEAIGFVDLDHRAKISTAQAALWEIPIDNHSVE
jgi:hypothetical protein